jgi:hypothetical protein
VAVTAKASIGRLARWLWPGEPSDPTSTALAWTGASLGMLAPLVALLPVVPAVKALPVLLFTCLGPGAAVVCRVRLGDAVAAWAMTLVLSLSTVAALAAGMAWLRLWHPSAGLVLLGMAMTAACVPLLVRRLWWPDQRSAVLPLVGATAVKPWIEYRLAPDATTVIPAPIGDVPPGATTVLPAVGEGWGTRIGEGWLIGEHGLSPSRMRRPVAGAGPPDETTVLPVIPDDRLIGGIGPMFGETVLCSEPVGPRRARPVPTLPRPPDGRPAPAARPATAEPPAAWRARWLTGRSIGNALLLGAVLALWVVSLALSTTAGVGDYGLLSVMHPTFFAAAALCATGFVIELYRRDPRWPVLLGYLVLLLLILHATVPVLVHEPEYAWTYKHLGVIDHIRTRGAVDNPDDIYLQWPTFFALGSQVVAVTGLSGLRLATWAPLFFDALNCLPLFAIARTLSSDRRVPFLTVFLFTSINWVAQDYLSPQGFSFVLCLGTLMIMLRWLRRVPGRADRKPLRLIPRLWASLQSGLVEVPYTSARTRNLALGALYLVYAVVATSHQLSPYIVAMSATGLVVLGLIRPVRVVPILLGIAVLYLLPRHQVADNYGLFNGFNLFHNVQGVGPVLGTTAGRVFSAHVVQLVAVAVWGLAGLAVLNSRRRLGPVAVPAVVGFAPFGLLLAQSYGGEAIYRVYLFTAPWCAYLIASMVLRWRWRWVPRAVGLPGAAVALTGAMLACLQGEHGQLVFDQFSRAEVEAANFIYTHAPLHSSVVMTIDNFPTRLTADYPLFRGGPNGDVSLVEDADLEAHTLTDADLPVIDSFFRAREPDSAFLVISPAMAHFAHFFGYLPDGAIDNLRTTIAKSPNFVLYYRNLDVVIYRYMPSADS